jgi:RNA recognition motif-containing protein
MSFHLVQIIKDRDTGRPKGYGFVMFENIEDARDAIYAMDQKVVCKKHPLPCKELYSDNSILQGNTSRLTPCVWYLLEIPWQSHQV